MEAVDVFTNTESITRTSMRPPSKFNVVLYNDDTTTMWFVVLVLISLFHKTIEEAQALAEHIHNNGTGVAGTYGHEIAMQKRNETIAAARANGYPLRCEISEST